MKKKRLDRHLMELYINGLVHWTLHAMKLSLLLPAFALSQDAFTTVYAVSQKLVNRELGMGSDKSSKAAKLYSDLN